MSKNKIVALLAFIATHPAYAEKLEEITVFAHRSPTSIVDAPVNLFAITQEQIQATNAEHIHALISQVPGVNYQQGSGQESLPGIRSAVLTGAGACGNVLVLEDGIAVRGPAFCNVNELFDTHFEHANQIEVIRGPGSAIYGSNSLNGSINVSLQPYGRNVLQLDIGEDNFVRAKAALSYGNRQANDNHYGRLYATVTDTDGFRDDSGYRQQKYSWRHHSTLNQWQAKLGATYTHLDQETAGFLVGDDAYLDAERITENANPEAFRKSDSFRAWAKLSRALSDSSSLTLTPYVRHTDMDFLLHFLPGQPLETNQQDGVGLQAIVLHKPSGSVSWSWGLDADVSNGELSQTQALPTSGSAFLQATIPTGTHYNYAVDSQQFALFSELDWRINEQFETSIGLRGEYLKYDYDNRALDGRTRDDGTACAFGGCRYSRPADRSDSFSNLSPKLELKYTLNESLKLYASASRSFRAPQATELYRLQRQQSVADLDSVRATSYEMGVKYELANLVMRANVYALSQRNVIIRDSNFFNIDGNRTKSKGVELSFQHRLSPKLTWQSAITVASHQYDSEQISGGVNIRGNDIDTAPKSMANVKLNWSPYDNINAGLNFEHVGEYYLDPENENQYPGHNLWHLSLAYTVNDSLKTTLRVDNVSNKRYAERADFTGFSGERYFPGRPRALMLSLEYRL